jgi:hypothetical protein
MGAETSVTNKTSFSTSVIGLTWALRSNRHATVPPSNAWLFASIGSARTATDVSMGTVATRRSATRPARCGSALLVESTFLDRPHDASPLRACCLSRRDRTFDVLAKCGEPVSRDLRQGQTFIEVWTLLHVGRVQFSSSSSPGGAQLGADGPRPGRRPLTAPARARLLFGKGCNQ